MVYRDYENDPSEEITALMPIFYKKMRELFGDETKKEHLKNLGATNLDFAFLSNNLYFVNDPTINHEDKSTLNIYEIANNLRFFDIWKKAYNIIDYNPHEYTHICFNSGEKIPLPEDQPLSIEKNIIGYPKTLAMIFQGSGERSWNYKHANYEHRYTDLFDLLVSYGDGAHHIILDCLENLFNQDKVKILKEIDLDFAYIRIHMHDNKEGRLQKVIECLPDDLAKETLYFIQTCHSGQYHKHWNKNGYLITSAGENQSSYFTDYKVEKLQNYFEGPPNLNGFIKFFNDSYKSSTPHISGNINGNVIKNTPINEYVTKYMTSQEEERTIIEVNNTEAAIIPDNNLKSILDSSIDQNLNNVLPEVQVGGEIDSIV